MSRNDEGDSDDDSSNKQLPRPEVVLEEERHGRKRRGDDATDGLRPEMENDTRHETTHAAHQANKGEET